MAEPLADAPGGRDAARKAPPSLFSDRAPPPQRPCPLVRAPGLSRRAQARAPLLELEGWVGKCGLRSSAILRRAAPPEPT